MPNEPGEGQNIAVDTLQTARNSSHALVSNVPVLSLSFLCKPSACFLTALVLPIAVSFQTTDPYTLQNYELFFWLENVFIVLKEKKNVMSDSLSSLKVIFNLKYEHCLGPNSRTTYELNQRWEGDCLCLGPWPCGH